MSVNRILLKKLRNALKSEYPLETVKELVSEYEDLYRLYLWRKDILKKGKNLERYDDEIKRIGEMLDEYGITRTQCDDDDIMVEIKKYFREI